MRKILKKKNIKYYLIYYVIMELILGFPLIKFIPTVIYYFFKIVFKLQNFEMAVKAIILLIILIILFMMLCVFWTLPVTIALLARKAVDSAQERQNRKYTSRENIIYYREKLNGISPATISLMKNLKIEEEKDLIATIVKLQLNGNILLEEDTIKILSNDVSNLMPTEEFVLQELQKGKMSRLQIENWKDLALEEAKSQGYIKEKSSTQGIVIKKVALITLFILLILGSIHFSRTFLSLYDKIQNIGITDEMEIIEVVEFEDADFIINTFLNGLLTVICVVGIFAWPIFYIVYIVRYKNKNNSLKRTSKGESLTDEILGMKRFIHDFSMLNEADKEEIELWDDFLVYAIVLEENEKIIEEILQLKNVKILDVRINSK